MTQHRLLIALTFFVAPALIYIALLTRFSFDLFAPTYGWQAYNHYAMAIAQGRQSLPAEVISGEGLYIGGKVFMYYGVLPAVVRLPLMALIDLRTVPVSNFIMAVMLIAGQWAMQLAVLRIFAANARTHVRADRAVLVLISLAIWFMSGPFLIVQKADFYHEPYAAAMMLTGIYAAMLSQDLLVRKQRPAGARLLVYALIAGLSVYARQSCAIGLYAVTLALLLPEWPDLRSRPGQTVMATIRRAIGPLLILFLFGAGFIAMAYFRTGKIGTGWTVEDYGYYILGNNRPRLRTMIEQQFSAIRIIPNTIYFLVGGMQLRERLILAWGGGLVSTFGVQVRWAIYASLPLIMALAGLVCVSRRLLARQPLAVPVALSAAGYCLIMLVIFSYGTSQVRYNAEAWPVIVWLMLVAMRDIEPSRLFGRWQVPALAAAFGLTALSLAYSATWRLNLLTDVPRYQGSLRVGVPLPPQLAALATAPDARDPHVIPVRDAFGPDPYLLPAKPSPGNADPAR